MSRVVKITESNLIKIIKNIIKEQSEGEEDYYDITPEQYYKLLSSVGNHAHAIPSLPMFRGKGKLRVVGNLNLAGKPIKSLGELSISGQLDFRNTNIKSLEGVEYGVLGTYYGTPYAEEIERRKKQKEREMKCERSGIYSIECKDNKRVYIGSAINLSNRFFEHTRKLKQNKHNLL